MARVQLAQGPILFAQGSVYPANSFVCFKEDYVSKGNPRLSMYATNYLFVVDSGSGAFGCVVVDLRVVSGARRCVYRHLVRGKCGIVRAQLAQGSNYLAQGSVYLAK